MSLQSQELSAAGARRITPAMLAWREQANGFQGVAADMAKPLRFLAAFQEAEPYLGLPPQAFKLVAWLVKMTQKQDWGAGARPIAWPSVARQMEFLGLSESRVKTLNRLLCEAGIFVFRDHPTGKRFGRRAPDGGQIIEAYGFDLSPLAIRHEEFIRLAAEARAERDRCRSLKRRATTARRSIAQIGETLAGLGPLPSGWPLLAAETAELVAEIRCAGSSADLALIVKALESRNAQAEAWVLETSKGVKIDPEGPADRPHSISTNPSLYLSDTVIAAEESSCGGEGRSQTREAVPGENDDLEEAVAFKAPSAFQRIEKLHPGELLLLAPRLEHHTRQEYPSWADIVDAAGDGLRHDLGVSQALWGEACLKVGRQMATVILAVVSTKGPGYFTRGAGGYFAAMVKRAKSGELHLERSLWKLRRDRVDRFEPKSQARGRNAWH